MERLTIILCTIALYGWRPRWLAALRARRRRRAARLGRSAHSAGRAGERGVDIGQTAAGGGGRA